MKRVAIVDYGMCNLDSVARAVEECGGNPVITDQADEIGRATSLILPGVGAFAEAMANLRSRGLDKILDEQVRRERVPILGICLGMQLMASEGDEGGKSSGLGWIDARVRRLVPTSVDRRIPHIGWNRVDPADNEDLFRGLEGRDFYFVHSYCVEPYDMTAVLATTPYCSGFTSAVRKENVYGVQFHPEKSQRSGFQLLRNFLEVS